MSVADRRGLCLAQQNGQDGAHALACATLDCLDGPASRQIAVPVWADSLRTCSTQMRDALFLSISAQNFSQNSGFWEVGAS